MKIIFVGIHNKPGMKPLDSQTVTGKMVDQIATRFRNIPFQKTNLCDTDHFPDIGEEPELIIGYKQRITYDPGDVFVLLGQWVHKNFPRIDGVSIVKLPHPASEFGTVKKKIYVENAVNKISVAIVKNLTHERIHL